MPTPDGSSGVAWNAAKLLPSAASSSRSSCETAAPAIAGIGGRESSSKHIGRSLDRQPPRFATQTLARQMRTATPAKAGMASNGVASDALARDLKVGADKRRLGQRNDNAAMAVLESQVERTDEFGRRHS